MKPPLIAMTWAGVPEPVPMQVGSLTFDEFLHMLAAKRPDLRPDEAVRMWAAFTGDAEVIQ